MISIDISKAVDLIPKKIGRETVYVIDKTNKSMQRNDEEKLARIVEEYNSNYAKKGVYL